MVNATTQLTVVVKEVSSAVELNNRVVSRPAQNRLEDAAAVGEGTHWALAGAVAEEVRVAGGIGEVVGISLLVQPGGLEEAAVVVIAEDWFLGLGVEDDDVLDFFGELAHVVGKLADLCALGCDALAADLLRTLPIGVVEVVALLVALELATPETTEVEVSLAIVIDEAGWVNAEAALDGLWVGGEWSLGLVANSDTNAEDAVLIAGREVEVVFAVLGRAVRSPKLLGNPRDVFGLEDDTVVGHLAWR